MDIQKLEILLKTIDAGSLTQTAQVLGYSQSAISHAVSSMEEQFGVQLLLRSRSGVRLTPEGAALLPYIRNVSTSWREMQNKVAEMHNLDYGSIRIGTFTSVAVNWLPGILHSFKEQHPSVKFEIKQGNYAQIAEWIIQDEIDCGFTIMPRKKGLRHVPLMKDQLIVIFSKDHPLSRQEVIQPEQLAQYPFVMVDEGADPIIRNFFVDREITLDIQYRVVDDYAVIAMVESGLGISVCPELFFSSMPFNVGSQRLNTEYRRPVSISYKDNFTISPVVSLFIDHVQVWVQENYIEQLERRSREPALPFFAI